MDKLVQYITPDLIKYQLANLSQLVFEVTAMGLYLKK